MHLAFKSVGHRAADDTLHDEDGLGVAWQLEDNGVAFLRQQERKAQEILATQQQLTPGTQDQKLGARLQLQSPPQVVLSRAAAPNPCIPDVQDIHRLLEQVIDPDEAQPADQDDDPTMSCDWLPSRPTQPPAAPLVASSGTPESLRAPPAQPQPQPQPAGVQPSASQVAQGTPLSTAVKAAQGPSTLMDLLKSAPRQPTAEELQGKPWLKLTGVSGPTGRAKTTRKTHPTVDPLPPPMAPLAPRGPTPEQLKRAPWLAYTMAPRPAPATAPRPRGQSVHIAQQSGSHKRKAASSPPGARGSLGGGAGRHASNTVEHGSTDGSPSPTSGQSQGPPQSQPNRQSHLPHRSTSQQPQSPTQHRAASFAFPALPPSQHRHSGPQLDGLGTSWHTGSVATAPPSSGQTAAALLAGRSRNAVHVSDISTAPPTTILRPGSQRSSGHASGRSSGGPVASFDCFLGHINSDPGHTTTSVSLGQRPSSHSGRSSGPDFAHPMSDQLEISCTPPLILGNRQPLPPQPNSSTGVMKHEGSQEVSLGAGVLQHSLQDDGKAQSGQGRRGSGRSSGGSRRSGGKVGLSAIMDASSDEEVGLHRPERDAHAPLPAPTPTATVATTALTHVSDPAGQQPAAAQLPAQTKQQQQPGLAPAPAARPGAPDSAVAHQQGPGSGRGSTGTTGGRPLLALAGGLAGAQRVTLSGSGQQVAVGAAQHPLSHTAPKRSSGGLWSLLDNEDEQQDAEPHVTAPAAPSIEAVAAAAEPAVHGRGSGTVIRTTPAACAVVGRHSHPVDLTTAHTPSGVHVAAPASIPEHTKSPRSNFGLSDLLGGSASRRAHQAGSATGSQGPVPSRSASQQQLPVQAPVVGTDVFDVARHPGRPGITHLAPSSTGRTRQGSMMGLTREAGPSTHIQKTPAATDQRDRSYPVVAAVTHTPLAAPPTTTPGSRSSRPVSAVDLLTADTPAADRQPTPLPAATPRVVSQQRQPGSVTPAPTQLFDLLNQNTMSAHTTPTAAGGAGAMEVMRSQRAATASFLAAGTPQTVTPQTVGGDQRAGAGWWSEDGRLLGASLASNSKSGRRGSRSSGTGLRVVLDSALSVLDARNQAVMAASQAGDITSPGGVACVVAGPRHFEAHLSRVWVHGDALPSGGAWLLTDSKGADGSSLDLTEGCRLFIHQPWTLKALPPKFRGAAEQHVVLAFCVTRL